MKSTDKRYAAVGLRLGINFTIPDAASAGGTRFVRNGEIATDDQAAITYLREVGYKLEPCAGVPEFDEEAVAASDPG